MTRALGKAAALTGLVAICSAHIGSPDAWYEGTAGPYRVLVQVVTPGVVPGVARVFARVTGDGVQRVTVQTNRFDALAASPPPEIAEPVENDQGLYSAPLWVMAGGSNSVTVSVTGTKGSGKAVIPVVVVPTRRLEFGRKLAGGLLAIGVFLVIGLITIVGAAVREGVLAPGEQPDRKRRFKARAVMGAVTAALALVLFGGLTWWNREDASFNRSIFKPLKSSSSVIAANGATAIHLMIDDSVWTQRNDTAWLTRHASNRWTPLIPDHGKLMHLFVVKDGDLSAFAHLHPVSSDSVTFASSLFSMPAGRYRVYADIVHESGFTETLASTLSLPSPVVASGPPTDADDASYVGAASSSGQSALGNGATMTLERGAGPIVEGRDANLRFVVRGADGKPLALEPYIGMAGHAAVTRDDGSVFVHLHPSGTISMASQITFLMRKPSDSIAGTLSKRMSEQRMPAMTAGEVSDGVVSFPYAFPKPGRYHMWVQVKHAGHPLTGAFALEVAPASR